MKIPNFFFIASVIITFFMAISGKAWAQQLAAPTSQQLAAPNSQQLAAPNFQQPMAAKTERTPWFDQSHEILIPRQVDKKLLGYLEFPIFWWNFLVFEFPSGSKEIPQKGIPWADLRQNCTDSLHGTEKLIRLSPCEKLDGSLKDILADWSRDYFLRHPKVPDTEVHQQFMAGLAKASLPMDASLLGLLRMDPFNSLEEYRQKVLGRVGLNFENHQGLFFEAEYHRVLIPIQMLAAPAETRNVNEILKAAEGICRGLGCRFLGGVGPHFSTWENESQIRQDVQTVSKVGWIVLVGFGLFFIFSRRWKLLFLFPPLLLTTAFVAFLTYLIFGKIHGLTLAFGPSIVGMAIDYGLHGAFEGKAEKGIWRANLFGLLTTLAVFFVLLFSQLPILNQIAVFSILGLAVSFILFFIMKLYFSRYYHVRPFTLRPGRSGFFRFFSMVLLVVGLLTPFVLRPDLSLRQLNYENPVTAEVRNWVYAAGKTAPPLIDVSVKPGISILQGAGERVVWGEEHHLSLTNVAVFLPSLEKQRENLATWDPLLCRHEGLDQNTLQFFAPFWKKVDCPQVKTQDLSPAIFNQKLGQAFPRYLQDLYSKGKWVTLWFPKDNAESKLIQERFPESESFLHVMSFFSETLEAELLWIVPASLLLAFSFLFFHSRSVRNSLLCVVPFFSGLGLFMLVSSLAHFSLSFITIIGLIMVFGFSIDYGIFMVNLLTANDYKEGHGVRTSVSIASMTTIMGFSPLMFALHPALRHLGQSLFLGAIGAYIGAIWGIPTLYATFVEKRK